MTMVDASRPQLQPSCADMRPAQVRSRQVCDHCGGRFGMVTHRWWGSKFCKPGAKMHIVARSGWTLCGPSLVRFARRRVAKSILTTTKGKMCMIQAQLWVPGAPAGICRTFASIRCRKLKKKALLLLRAERGTEVCTCALTEPGSLPCSRK